MNSYEEVTANRIKLSRKRAGFKNIRQAAIALDLSYSTYWDYENGNRFPSQENMIKISRKFVVSIDYLYGNSDDPGEFITKEEILEMLPEYKERLDRDELELIELYKGVKDKLTVKKLKRIIDALVKEDL